MVRGGARCSMRIPATLILISSGITTAGGFDLRQVGWDADPATVAAELKNRGLLPDLRGWTIVFAGLGNTAGRQPPLPLSQRATLTAYWTAICHATAAVRCIIDDSPRPDLPPRSTASVPIVPVPQVLSVQGPHHSSRTVIPAEELFAFDSATLGPAADRILAPLVAQARVWHLKVSITGHASPDGGSETYNTALSVSRALAVRARLIALGIPDGQITHVTGIGTAGEAPDACYSGGRLNEVICAQLRRVVIVLSPLLHSTLDTPTT
jgi:outer membrane protein OmpA-like peptidoglycan-associated protein